MASVGGVSGNNLTSSLYNSANVISGLASGLDTEGMIEGLVQSYQKKIQSLNNKITKTEWKQEAYRSIINKMNSFASKYTSYTSNTNLMSASFFNNAINVASMGENKSKVSASGRTDSDVKITSIKQLATAARYSTAGNLKGISEDFSITADEAVNFSDRYTMGALSGSLSLQYGSQTVSIVFDQYKDMIPETKTVEKSDGTTEQVKLTSAEKAQELQKMIEKKLGETQVTLSTGASKSAADLIKVDLSGGRITFSDKTSGKNTVYISDASDSVKNTLGLDLENAKEKKPATIDTNNITSYVRTTSVGSHISGKAMNVTLDGKTKSITMPRISGEMLVDAEGKVLKDENGRDMEATGDNYAKVLQKSLDEKFGTGKFKVSNEAVKEDGTHDSGALQLKIKAPDNSDFSFNSDAGQALGMDNASTNYLNTNKTLGELMNDDAWKSLAPAKAVGSVTVKDGKRVDQKGNLVDENNNLVDADGNPLFAFKVNGVTVGNYGKDTKLSTIMNDINNNTEAGVRASYSQTTRQFTFTSKDTGVENEIEFDGLAKSIFGGTKVVDTDKLSEARAKEIMGTNDSMSGKRIKMTVGGKEIDYTISGTDPSIKNIMDVINGQLRSSGMTASLSEKDGSLVVKDKDGNEVDVKFDETDTFAKNLFANAVKKKDDYLKDAATYTKGQDAVFSANINGQDIVLTRGSNSTSLDGMTVNLKDTFNTDYIADRAEGDKEYILSGKDMETEAVTFQRTTDSDKIVEAVRGMVEEYNAMMSEIRNQYATLPYRKTSNGAFSNYDPLTEEDKATMSESAIKAYEEKAKQGLLFNDTNLSGLYDKMRGIFTTGGTDQQALQQMGLSISYSSVDGSAQLSLNENKLREALDSDPDAVADAFTRMGGDGQNPGIMQSMKTQLDRYAGLTGATKGILVQQAGTPLNSLSLINNSWQKEIDTINNQVEKWQDKLASQVDKYTSMFSKLEVLINQMNSQSSTLAGLLGG